MGASCCKSTPEETDLIVLEAAVKPVTLAPEPAEDTPSVGSALKATKMEDQVEAEDPGSPSKAARKKKSKHFMIRKTVELKELELTPEDIEARCGDEDPDLDALHEAAEAREEAKKSMKRSANRKGTGAVPKQADTTGVQFQEEEEEPKGMKRSANRKGTAAAPKQADPTGVQFQQEEEEDASTDKPLKRVQQRKGTGAPVGMGKGTTGVVIAEDSEDDEDEDEADEEEEVEEAPKIAPKRAKGRKGTGFVKPSQMPEEEEDEEDSTDASDHKKDKKS